MSWFRRLRRAAPRPSTVDPFLYCQVLGCPREFTGHIWGWRFCDDHGPDTLSAFDKEPAE
jgi:hypothetical protein